MRLWLAPGEALPAGLGEAAYPEWKGSSGQLTPDAQWPTIHRGRARQSYIALGKSCVDTHFVQLVMSCFFDVQSDQISWYQKCLRSSFMSRRRVCSAPQRGTVGSLNSMIGQPPSEMATSVGGHSPKEGLGSAAMFSVWADAFGTVFGFLGEVVVFPFCVGG